MFCGTPVEERCPRVNNKLLTKQWKTKCKTPKRGASQYLWTRGLETTTSFGSPDILTWILHMYRI